MANKNSAPIRLVISRCLLGEAVRYDGASKTDAGITALGQLAELIPVCPEVETGLGIPRPPVQLIKANGCIEVRGVENRELDITRRLQDYATAFANRHRHAHGWILKARSPSCGVNDTPLFNQHDDQIGMTSGMFAHTVQSRLSGMPMISETQFQAPLLRNSFFERVFVCRRWQAFKSSGVGLEAFHARMRGHILARTLQEPQLEVMASTLSRLAERNDETYFDALMTFIQTPVSLSALTEAIVTMLAETEKTTISNREIKACLQGEISLPALLEKINPQPLSAGSCFLLEMTEQEWALRALAMVK